MPKNKKTTTTNKLDKPPVGPDEFTVVLSKDEMVSLSQILLFSKNVFAEMALNFQKDGSMVEADRFNARSVLSQLLFEKFKDLTVIGEPESRQIH